MSKQTRRDFLKNSALSSIALGTGYFGGRNGSGIKKSEPGQAKNVIFLVSDGMSTGTLTLADLIKQSEKNEPTYWINLYRNPDREFYRGLMDMTPLNSNVTDSSAASSSWGCGRRINNGAVNMGPNNEVYRTILEIFRGAGKGTGLVTTTRITHATPAGFGANAPSRGMEDEIAEQYSDRDYDLLMGGGNRHFDPESRSDGQDLYQKMIQKGYQVARNKTELKQADPNSKLLGIFYDSHLPYTVDHKNILELRDSVPTLAEMTTEALNHLETNENGFILQIEGGRVDHAAHGNDAAGMIYDQISFDDAVKVVMDYTKDRDDTLVILTTDHGNANPGLSAHGSGYEDSPKMLNTLRDYRRSFEWLYGELDFYWSDESPNDNVSVNRVREVLEFATNTQITKDQANKIHKAFRREFRSPYGQRNSAGAVMSGVLANYNGVYFISTSHTADYVEIAAWGPGSDQLKPFVRNTELFDLMVETAGVQEYAEG
ncbi:MAG: alkaline phosphatase [Balneolaceae bacterium]|nr:alkaline phosphatase [Balneolaceae bacterium]